MTTLHEAEVAARFDQLHNRFKRVVATDDVRLRALWASLEPVHGRFILDLGCGKGRFASRLVSAGAEVIGLDLSAGMLAEAMGLDRVRGSARRLPFPASTFDGVVAIEVFEHLPSIDDVLCELLRVLRPGGVVSIIDKNAGSMNAQRPWLPNLIVKKIDEIRGRCMYAIDSPVREQWFWEGRFRKRLGRWFSDIRVEHLLSPSEARFWMFRHVPAVRLFTLWSARVPGGPL